MITIVWTVIVVLEWLCGFLIGLDFGRKDNDGSGDHGED